MLEMKRVAAAFAALFLCSAMSVGSQAAEPSGDEGRDRMDCQPYTAADGSSRRTICADVAALDHMLVYNRFGSFNPFGMIFALKRDLSSSEVEPVKVDADLCDDVTGAEEGVGALEPGKVRLKDCKRPRPLVLRANVGDVLHVRVTNYLTPNAPDLSRDFCKGDLADSKAKRDIRAAVSEGSEAEATVGETMCATEANAPEDEARGPSAEWPSTRSLSLAIQGLAAIPGADAEANKACLGLISFEPGRSVDCFFEIDREGTYFLSSKAAPSGGEGNGGSITHGLFGAVVAEQPDTAWYRSQVNKGALDSAWKRSGEGCEATGTPAPHSRLCALNYDKGYAASEASVPELRITKQIAGGAEEIVHSDLNAIIYRPKSSDLAEVNFREFSVFFHDELKSFYTKNYEELAQFGQLAGVRDGFAINYGSSGMGTMLLANRKRIGPANDCPECLYEEFFLQSWANGDPALLEQFPDDPSNVHHSYLNDRIVFRNFHAGPKETHVFHLHAHQWFAGNDGNRGAYLDSQTVAPQQGFTYNIYGGGLNGNPPVIGSHVGDKDSWQSLGSGNRNRTIGDSIFHCHLYPHFAQGMWELWRVHDTLEDGTRKLPDGQKIPGYSLTERVADAAERRHGSFDPATGALAAGTGSAIGTPIPGIVPLPDMPLPPIPSYATNGDPRTATPGYPFYIAGKPGHRAPQAPLDIATDKSGNGEFLDGGLPRHVVKDGGERELEVSGTLQGTPGSEERRASQQQLVAKMLALGNFAGHLKKAELDLLPYDGSTAEKAAMAFHYNGAGVTVRNIKGDVVGFDSAKGGYGTVASPPANGGTSGFPNPAAPIFHVNGAAAKPGAPFADPCGVSTSVSPTAISGNDPLYNSAAPFFADPALIGFRRYEASAIQLNLVTNRAGWHDPQGRMNVLSAISPEFKDSKSGTGLSISPTVRGDREPFFFRALSGECIEFRHTNELPKDLERDDFQVRTPTDTIGQHIHLVKFDVTSSDGSGNGWNYEDGTLAADEIASRICAYRTKLQEDDPGSLGTKIKAVRLAGELAVRMPDGFCEDPITTSETWWRQKLPDARQHFQTTVQRWFADPILSPSFSPTAAGGPEPKAIDRTLRTVFTHDHFGPSSIQQHGFYSALLIEPRSAVVCKPTEPSGQAGPTTCTQPRAEGDHSLAEGNADWVGARKIVATDPAKDPTHPDYREYALAIADFATLYDPRDYETTSEFLARTQGTDGGSPEGLGTLVCEGQHRGDPTKLNSFCGSGLAQEASLPGQPWHGGEDTPPAWVAAGKTGALARGFTLASLLSQAEVDQLREATIDYRKRAAGNPAGDRLAKPISAPSRPEAISVDHHDPYLVNYRGEPIPLRIGTKNENGTVATDCTLRPIDSFVQVLQNTAQLAGCSISHQVKINPAAPPFAGPSGDMADVFLSAFHGDPVTPIIEAYDGERVVMRLVQGAQEVQHTFNIDGYTFQRHIDQGFGTGHTALAVDAALTPSATAPLNLNCQNHDVALSGRPTEYAKWRKEGSDGFTDAAIKAFWKNYEHLVATCDNAEGLTSAQEVGISEHFEFSGHMRQANPGVEGLRRSADNPTTDYFYSFGSMDAIWNGAWGLTRIFRNEGARDNSVCDPNAENCNSIAGSRLLSLTKARGSSALPALQPDESALRQDVAANQILSCRAGAPRVHAIIAAVEVARVWPNGIADNGGDTGTNYGKGLYDRNGLMFALVDPQGLFGAKAQAALEYDPADNSTAANASLWQNIKLDKIASVVRATYARPEPLVLRVNANDCITLHVVNGLVPYRATGGLKDDRGDAPMPRITGLNVDSNWEMVESAAPESENSQRPAQFQATGGGDVRPSARLGVSIPLPSLDYSQSIPLPFGQNLTSTLAPAKCAVNGSGYPTNCTVSMTNSAISASPTARFVRRQDSIERQTFYAGRSAITTNFNTLMVAVVEKMDASSAVPHSVDTTLTTDELLPPPSANADTCAADQATDVELLGRTVRLCLRAADDSFQPLVPDVKQNLGPSVSLDIAARRIQAAWNAAAQEILAGDEYVNWTPYAFGTLPIKSTGDVVGHGSHGLFGAMIVEAQGAKLPAGERVSLGSVIALKPRDAGQMWSAKIEANGICIDGSGPMANCTEKHNIREFVVFYQDGLNLRDRNTANRWKSPDGISRLVADCEVCDDSYDLGDQGVNYRSDPFFNRLRGVQIAGQSQPEAQFNLNSYVFPKNFFLPDYKPLNKPMLRAEAGEEVIVRVIHPGGRARQRSFVTIGNDYDDLFPGFGFPHSALLAPGKGVRAAFTRKVREGCYLWHDGAETLNSGGTWGLIDVVPAGSLNDTSVTSCNTPNTNAASLAK